MRPILQSQTSECSLACLAMVGQAHGLGWDLAALRQRFPSSLKGATLQTVIRQAAALGLQSRPLRLDLAELGRLQVPCILHWDLNHFVVLTRVGRRGVTVMDPAVGERKIPLAEVSRHFTGVALELSPGPDFQPAKAAPRVSWRQLTGRVQGLAGALGLVLVVALALELFAVLAPLLNQLVVDEAIASNDQDLLAVLVLGFGLLLATQTALSLARSWMLLVLGQTLSLQWAGNVFAHLVRLPVAWFEQRHLGDVTSRFGAVHAIQQTLTQTFIEAVLDGVMVLAALAMMLLYSPRLTGVVVAAVVAYGLLRWASYGPLRQASAERLLLAAREHTHFLETVRAITPLKLFGREEERRARWQNLLVDVQNRDVRTARLNIAFSTANTALFGLENLLVLWLAARMIMDQHGGTAPGSAPFTVGMLFAFLAYKGQFSSRVSGLIHCLVQWKMMGLHAERLADIALTPPELTASAAALPASDLSHLEPSLELRNVSFRYGEGEPWVLRHAHLRVAAGECVAITGASGVGKTTLLKVLLGILPATEGEVLYGGLPVRQLGLANVRRQMGTVMQDDVLLTGSLAENISFFDPEPDPARVERCARLACLNADIARMPMGLHTLVGDLGSGLSGGQKQRLLLARALYREPRVLVLDEATSHLDPANERTLTHTLSDMRLTRLLIAHRSETLAGAQRVLQLRDAAVVEVMRAVPAPGIDNPSPSAIGAVGPGLRAAEPALAI